MEETTAKKSDDDEHANGGNWNVVDNGGRGGRGGRGSGRGYPGQTRITAEETNQQKKRTHVDLYI
jgi:hypothetical protein